jgi:hypothetical protein
VSRDEMASALVEVAEGRVPKDRIALKCLYEEIQSWWGAAETFFLLCVRVHMSFVLPVQR